MLWMRCPGQCAQYFMSYECRIGEEAISHTTIDWCSFCREICGQDLLVNPPVIGGFDENVQPKVVEINESKFGCTKYNRGRVREGHWVFGGIERGNRNCFLVSADTLLPLIQKYILPGTIINMSDGWRAYDGISQLGGGVYQHQVVVHEGNFVDPNDPQINTQNVENMWMRAKRKLQSQFGTSRPLFQSYLDEFV